MPDNSNEASGSGWAITFGILSFVLAGTTAVSAFMWNKERKKNIAANEATQASANTAASGSGQQTTVPPGYAATGQTATQAPGTQTKK